MSIVNSNPKDFKGTSNSYPNTKQTISTFSGLISAVTTVVIAGGLCIVGIMNWGDCNKQRPYDSNRNGDRNRRR